MSVPIKTPLTSLTVFLPGVSPRQFSFTSDVAKKVLHALEQHQAKAAPEDSDSVSAIPFMNRGFARLGYGACALAAARFKASMTQTFLGKATGIRPEHISAMEAGKRPIGERVAKRLALALEMDWEDLVRL